MIEELKIVDGGRDVSIYGIMNYAKEKSVMALWFAFYLGANTRSRKMVVDFYYFPQENGSSYEGDFFIPIMAPGTMASQLIEKLIEHRADKAKEKAKREAEEAIEKAKSMLIQAEKEEKTRAEFALFALERAKKERKERIISALINEPIIDTKPPDVLTAVNLSIDHWKRIRAFVEVAPPEEIVERLWGASGHIISKFCGLCKYFHVSGIKTSCGSCLSVIDAGCEGTDFSPWQGVNEKVNDLKYNSCDGFDRKQLLGLIDDMLETLGKYKELKKYGSFPISYYPYSWSCSLPGDLDCPGDCK